MADWRCPCHGQSSSDRSQIATIGDVDSTAVTIRTRKGRLAQINTSRRDAWGSAWVSKDGPHRVEIGWICVAPTGRSFVLPGKLHP